MPRRAALDTGKRSPTPDYATVLDIVSVMLKDRLLVRVAGCAPLRRGRSTLPLVPVVVDLAAPTPVLAAWWPPRSSSPPSMPKHQA